MSDLKGDTVVVSADSLGPVSSHLTDEYTNKDLFGVVRGHCAGVRGMHSDLSSRSMHVTCQSMTLLLAAVQGLWWLLEGYSRLHCERRGQGRWGRRLSCISSLLA